MFGAFVLLILLAGIVVASRRWPEIEEKLFPDEVEKITPEQAVIPEVKPEERETTPIANGFMQKRELVTEPDVDPDAFKKTASIQEPVTVTQPAPTVAKDPTMPAPPASVQELLDEQAEIDSKPEPAAPKAPEPPAVPSFQPKPVNPSRIYKDSPGGLVTGAPAMPSQPAYIDATKDVGSSAEDLMSEADRAYKERDYVRAERACLKILLKQPRNHKYMTRIGQIYKEMGALEDAREAFKEAKKLDAKNFFVLNQLSEVERLIAEKPGKTKVASE